MPEPTFKPENRTRCIYTLNNHVWVWDDDENDFVCQECGVTNENQEDKEV